MREEIRTYIGTLNLGGFLLSQEVPWSENGNPLYLKNPKRIYVDVDQIETDPFIQTLSGVTISNQINVVRLYFSTDAKQVPSNYSDIVESLRRAKDITTIQGVNRRECLVNTSYENDMLVTELEYRFTKLST